MREYEISLWEDNYNATSESIVEEKIMIIGSHTMTAQWRATQPKLVSNINGSHTFTFKMLINYIDTETGEKTLNPILNLLVNERKIKAKWKNEWYDLIIKDRKESSDGSNIIITCKDQHINELSKTGFNLEFNTELENNINTLPNFIDEVLEGTDWEYDANSDIIPQEKIDETYNLTNSSILNNFSATKNDGTSINILTSDNLLVFHSLIKNQVSKLKFFKITGKTIKYETSSRIIDRKATGLEELNVNVTYLNSNNNLYIYQNSTPILLIAENQLVSSDYRVRYIADVQKVGYDAVLGKRIEIYKKNGDNRDLYGYSETKYQGANYCPNYLVNSEDFVSYTGWKGSDNLHLSNPSSTSKSLLLIPKNKYILNTGLTSNATILSGGIKVGEKFYIDLIAYVDNNGTPSTTPIVQSNVSYVIGTFTRAATGDYSIVQPYFTISNNIATATTNITQEALANDTIGFFIKVDNSYNNIWVERIRFYRYQLKQDGINHYTPDDYSTEARAEVYYNYYFPSEQVGREAKDYIYEYVGTTPWNSAIPQYSENNEKRRSIEIKNSNRFNILQTLAETFECWLVFDIGHNSNGVVTYKKVRVAQTVGKEIDYGFIYGLDLKTIQRTINSSNIVSKIIVKPAENSASLDGICSIARSKENYSKSDFILNFDYYISQGLLNSEVIYRDLYDASPDSNSIGYLTRLRTYNTQYDSYKDQLVLDKAELNINESLAQSYKETEKAATDEKYSLEDEIKKLLNISTISEAWTYYNSHPNYTELKAKLESYKSASEKAAKYLSLYNNISSSIVNLKSNINIITEAMEDIVDDIKELDNQFYERYSRFIQEGSWTSNDYFDEDQYYFDSQETLYTSSRPEVKYNISVIRLSDLEDYESREFNLGDITYVYDKEFFGDDTKEKVVITEISESFMTPQDDIITVQNYKTQFEDLFQRVTAATQSLQYSTGSYQRAANAFEDKGTINAEILQNSISRNLDLVISAQNEHIYEDNTGMLFTDGADPNKRTKITSNGFFITTDGGLTWKNAIRGEGISTQYLTTGAINVDNIQIMSGSFPTFRWAKAGLDAYSFTIEAQTGNIVVDRTKFVRHDRFGIYGIQGTTEAPDVLYNSEAEIFNNAKFGLTWNRFFMKDNSSDGSISISSDNHIQIFDSNNNEVIKIGKLLDDSSSYYYGIRIKDGQGNSILETKQTLAGSSLLNELWLSGKLQINSGTGNIVQIGRLTPRTGESKIPVIVAGETNQNLNFIVFDDGSIEANDGIFNGQINANIGRIGCATIGTDSLSISNGSFNITGGNFKIGNTQNPQLNFENGVLTLSGTLNVSSGKIGDFNIGQNSISSSNGNLQLNSNGSISILSGNIGGFIVDATSIKSSNLNLILNSNGTITANNLTVGSGLQISDYLDIGNIKIYNPLTHSNKVFEIFNNESSSSIGYGSTDGIIRLENIEINTKQSKIRSINSKWEISEDTSIFNDISVQGIIKNAIFSTSTIQAAGGSILIRPTSKINSTMYSQETIEGTIKYYCTVMLEDSIGASFANQSKIALLVNGEISKETTLAESNNGLKFEITQAEYTEAINYTAAMLIYNKDANGYKDNLVIGINATNSPLTYSKKQSITFTQTGDSNIVRLLLGDLSTIPGRNYTGYGLYCDNAYLKGTLAVESTGLSKSAGINTNSTILFNKDPNNTDISPIIFWGGAQTDSATDIQNANFQVSMNGSLYANKGIFNDSVIANSTIEASTLKVAKIYGSSNGSAAPLSIYDTNSGIDFITERGTSPETIKLSISNSGFYSNNKLNKFIDLTNAALVEFSGKFKTTSLEIQNNEISFGSLIQMKFDKLLSSSDDYSLMFKYNSNNTLILEGANKLKYQGDNAQFKKNLIFGEDSNTGKLEYKQVNNGYDLYVG